MHAGWAAPDACAGGDLRVMRAPDVAHPWTRQLFQVRPKPPGAHVYWVPAGAVVVV
jgi:hypothetical protein